MGSHCEKFQTVFIALLPVLGWGWEWCWFAFQFGHLMCVERTAGHLLQKTSIQTRIECAFFVVEQFQRCIYRTVPWSVFMVINRDSSTETNHHKISNTNCLHPSESEPPPGTTADWNVPIAEARLTSTYCCVQPFISPTDCLTVAVRGAPSLSAWQSVYVPDLLPGSSSNLMSLGLIRYRMLISSLAVLKHTDGARQLLLFGSRSVNLKRDKILTCLYLFICFLAMILQRWAAAFLCFNTCKRKQHKCWSHFCTFTSIFSFQWSANLPESRDLLLMRLKKTPIYTNKWCTLLLVMSNKQWWWHRIAVGIFLISCFVLWLSPFVQTIHFFPELVC